MVGHPFDTVKVSTTTPAPSVTALSRALAMAEGLGMLSSSNSVYTKMLE